MDISAAIAPRLQRGWGRGYFTAWAYLGRVAHRQGKPLSVHFGSLYMSLHRKIEYDDFFSLQPMKPFK